MEAEGESSPWDPPLSRELWQEARRNREQTVGVKQASVVSFNSRAGSELLGGDPWELFSEGTKRGTSEACKVKPEVGKSQFKFILLFYDLQGDSRGEPASPSPKRRENVEAVGKGTIQESSIIPHAVIRGCPVGESTHPQSTRLLPSLNLRDIVRKGIFSHA